MQETSQLSYVFVIFFLILGPLKVIPIFNRVTFNASPNFRQQLAKKATILSSVIVFAVAIVGKIILGKWDVSTAALFIAGGLLLLLAALQMLGQFTLPKPLPQDTPPPSDDQILPLAINPLTIPAIITPYGVVAILVTTSQAEGDIPRQIGIFALLLLIIILNWLGMTFAKAIIQKINIISLIIIGWVFAVLQAGLAIDIMLEGLKRAKTILFAS
jgi:multiple antibiotic resistance protein